MPATLPPGVRPRRRLVRWILKPAMAVAAIAVVLTLGEGIMRVSGVRLPSPPIYPGDHEAVRNAHADPVLGWRCQPETEATDHRKGFSVIYRTNRQGFRGPRDFDPEPGFRRVAFVGDSFTFGTAVEDEQTFVRLVEERLADVRSLNFGLPAFGIDQMWAALRHFALRFGPDLVVLSFILDDLERSFQAYHWLGGWMEKPTFTLDGGRLVPLTIQNRPGALWRWVSQELRLYRAWLGFERKVMKSWGFGPTWRLNRAIIEAARDDCRKAGVPFLVMYIPLRSWPHRVPMFEQEFREMGVTLLDLSVHLPADRSNLWFQDDAHFTAAGHRFAAENLARFVAERFGWPMYKKSGPAPADGTGRGR
jgi:hypothetical protein